LHRDCCSKRFQSLTGQETVNIGTNHHSDSSATMTDLDSVKQEILAEVRREINKAKVEIIEGRSVSVEHITHTHTHLTSLFPGLPG